MMWLFIFFLWIFAAALFSMALGKAIHIADEAAERSRMQFQDGAR